MQFARKRNWYKPNAANLWGAWCSNALFTDLVKDTTDTSDSDGSPDIEIEYELATTDEENDLFDGSSSGTEVCIKFFLCKIINY